jgi:hypothetical protein
MTSFREIHASYLATDDFLSKQETRGRTANRKAHWAKLRRYNDHAYFVMMFAQLEQHIDSRCAALIVKKKSSAKWKLRRLWDAVDCDRLEFMRKVALLADKGQVTYAKIKAHYDTRCKIAHGDSASVSAIFLPAVIKDLQAIAKQLKSS